jgi:hypothetical protein
MFGSSEGNEQPLAFYYQVETLPILDRVDDANEEIIGKVETSISKRLLPSLFVEQCASIERTAKGKNPRHRRLEMMGLSSKPPDTVLQGGE